MERLNPPALLPPIRIPSLGDLQRGPVELRPLTAADGARAFAVAETALSWPEPLTPGEAVAQQHHWNAGMRLWSGWLQARAASHAWGAFRQPDNVLVGYARAIRDPQSRIEYLTELFVSPSFQGDHVGRDLLRAVLAPTVPDGWRRLIIAHPRPVPLALYHRWGTFPLATAWYLAIRALPGMPDLGNSGIHPLAMQAAPSRECAWSAIDGLCPLQWPADRRAMEWLDRAVLGRMRTEQHAFMLGLIGATGLTLHRSGTLVAYGIRTGEEIGPVVGETAQDTLRLTQALLAEAAAEAHTLPGLWVPGTNLALLRWLRSDGVRTVLGSQVTLMSSSPDLIGGLDRVVLTAPPYLG